MLLGCERSRRQGKGIFGRGAPETGKLERFTFYCFVSAKQTTTGHEGQEPTDGNELEYLQWGEGIEVGLWLSWKDGKGKERIIHWGSGLHHVYV